MAYIVVAHIFMAYIVMACIVMAYIVMALYSYGLRGLPVDAREHRRRHPQRWRRVHEVLPRLRRLVLVPATDPVNRHSEAITI